MKKKATILIFLVMVIALIPFIISSCNKEESLPKVNANFTGNKTTILVGETVAFIDLSIGEPNNWLWEFEGGAPNTSTDQNPIIQYSQPGIYPVKLTSSNSNNSDIELKNDFVQVLSEVSALFTASDSVFDQGSEITFTDLSVGVPVEWFWEFEEGIPASSTEQNPVVSYSKSGVFSIKLTVSNTLSASSITKKIISLPTDGLVAYYPFSGNPNDESGNGHNGTMNGGISITTDRFGNPNSAYEFDGIDDFINTSTTFDYADRSLSLWINPYDISGFELTTKVVITQDDDALNYGMLRVDFQDYEMRLWAGGLSGSYSTPSISINSWIHLVLIRDEEMTQYYVDNVLVHTSTSDSNGSTFNPNPDFIIGSGRTTANQFYKGKIDDIRIFNRVLNESEINALFAGN